ncbi:MAG TPA: hypothetical protein VFG91_10370 [Woeseiaceae bacterium]|nr:hypothetical protein [Woeseiaceae bacterium]
MVAIGPDQLGALDTGPKPLPQVPGPAGEARTVTRTRQQRFPEDIPVLRLGGLAMFGSALLERSDDLFGNIPDRKLSHNYACNAMPSMQAIIACSRLACNVGGWQRTAFYLRRASRHISMTWRTSTLPQARCCLDLFGRWQAGCDLLMLLSNFTQRIEQNQSRRLPEGEQPVAVVLVLLAAGRQSPRTGRS